MWRLWQGSISWRGIASENAIWLRNGKVNGPIASYLAPPNRLNSVHLYRSTAQSFHHRIQHLHHVLPSQQALMIRWPMPRYSARSFSSSMIPSSQKSTNRSSVLKDHILASSDKSQENLPPEEEEPDSKKKIKHTPPKSMDEEDWRANHYTLLATLDYPLLGHALMPMFEYIVPRFSSEEFLESSRHAITVIFEILSGTETGAIDWNALKPLCSRRVYKMIREMFDSYRAEGLIWKMEVDPSVKAIVNRFSINLLYLNEDVEKFSQMTLSEKLARTRYDITIEVGYIYNETLCCYSTQGKHTSDAENPPDTNDQPDSHVVVQIEESSSDEKSNPSTLSSTEEDEKEPSSSSQDQEENERKVIPGFPKTVEKICTWRWNAILVHDEKHALPNEEFAWKLTHMR